MDMSNSLENKIIDALFRGGALAPGGGLNSAAVVDGVWTASTAYTVGQVVIPHANMTGAGGKFLECTTAGTSGTNNALAVPAVGSTLTDSGVTWTSVSGMPTDAGLYFALYVANKGLRANSTVYALNDVVSLPAQGGAGGDNKQHLYKCSTAGTSAASQPQYNGVPGEVITDGSAAFTELSPSIDSDSLPTGLVEVSGGSYARIPSPPTQANYAGTQSSASTTASTGTGGTTSNNTAVTFATPTADWAVGSAMLAMVAIRTGLTAGKLRAYAPLNAPKNVANGDVATSFAAGAFTFQIDN